MDYLPIRNEKRDSQASFIQEALFLPKILSMSQQFHTLTISDIKRETRDTVSIAFDVPATLQAGFKFVPGQYLTLKTTINGEDIRRSYSICSSPSSGEWRVAVKEIENGKFSTHANRNLKAGDQLDVMTPEGNFKVDPGTEGKNYVFYAAGSGITPVLSMIKSILESSSDHLVYLYYGNRTADETIFKAELDQLAEQYMNFNLNYILSGEDSGSPFCNGRIDEDKCSHFFNTDQANLKIEGIYACGPQELVELVKDFYAHKGLVHKFHYELFNVSVKPAAGSNVGVKLTAAVTVIIDDEEVKFNLASDGSSILQAAQDAGADVPFSCKGGVCCTCKAKVMEGSASMDLNYALDESDVEEGFILTCQAHPTAEKVVVSFDEY